MQTNNTRTFFRSDKQLGRFRGLFPSAKAKNSRRFKSTAYSVVVNTLLAFTLTACGGGDPEPEYGHKPPPVDCRERPEACR